VGLPLPAPGVTQPVDDERYGRARRLVMTALLGLAGGGAGLDLFRSSPAVAHARAPEPAGDRERFMRHALELRDRAAAQGDQPYGAVVVKGGRIVGEGSSRVIVDTDPTAHAEMEALRDACRRLRTRDLTGCEIYASSRPCPMCETASYWARVSRVYFGAELTDGGAPRYPRC
jgi:tRNA(Arg) A34 adenosine deaminase TadA